MRKWLIRVAVVTGVVAGTWFAGVVGAHSAGADPTLAVTPDCKTVVTHLVDRPDGGNHGTWALDTFTRTVKLCRVEVVKPEVAAETVEVPTWTYHATVTDAGTFVTVTGAATSPHAGHAVAGGVHGTFKGAFTADFTAPADWQFFTPGKLDGKTFTGAAGGDNPTTSMWVQTLWSAGFKGSPINEDWSWVYKTCREGWIDNAKTQGNGPHDGDIIGRPCFTHSPKPTPSKTSASPSISASHSASPSASASTGGVVTNGNGDGDRLALTGVNVPMIAGGGLMILTGGVVLLILGLRRRRAREFIA